MPVISFKPEFVPKILNGSKSQTIRRIGKRTYLKGQTIYLYTGRYTQSDRKKIGQATIKEVYDLHILFSDVNSQEIKEVSYGHFVTDPIKDIEKFAKDDGFNTLQDFAEFFFKESQVYEGERFFNGQLIIWKNFEGEEFYHDD